MTDLAIGSRTFKVSVEGDPTRPALVLSHSLGADLTMWDAQIPALSEQFRVIRYDSRGHGGSPTDDKPVSIATLGRDVLDILDALGIETAHFLGLSMGGAVGLWLLAHAPHRIGRAVLANTAPRVGTPESWNARILSVLTTGMDATADASMERWFSPAFRAAQPDRVDAVRQVMRATSQKAYAACCATLRDFDLRDRLGELTHEILVVSGTGDPVVSPPEVEAFVAACGAKHVALDAQHLSNIEVAAAFNAAVLQFLTAKPAKVAPRRVAAKAAPLKPAAKRGGAGRRSNAARGPLKKAAAKRAKASPARPGVRKAKPHAEERRRPAARTTAARRPAAKAASKSRVTPQATKPKTAKPAAKTAKPAKTTGATAARKTPAKAGRKTAATRPVSTARRKAPLAAARAPVKKTPATKAKAPAKKTATRKAVVGKAVAKKAPAPRRKATTKPRRPTGRKK